MTAVAFLGHLLNENRWARLQTSQGSLAAMTARLFRTSPGVDSQDVGRGRSVECAVPAPFPRLDCASFTRRVVWCTLHPWESPLQSRSGSDVRDLGPHRGECLMPDVQRRHTA